VYITIIYSARKWQLRAETCRWKVLNKKINKVDLDYILLLHIIIGSKHNVDAMPKKLRRGKSVVPCRRFDTTLRSHFQGSAIEEEDWPIGCPETSIRSYNSTLRKIPKEPNFINFTPVFISGLMSRKKKLLAQSRL
jgi:hypothetical protein